MTLTYRSAQEAYTPPGAPLKKFANPNVVCEGWYAVCRSAELKRGEIRRVQIGAQELALYRSLSGTLGAMESACPHLGADLARGQMVEKGLQCAFHFWTWGADGLCTAGGGAPEGRRIRTYRVEERWGIAWLWAGTSPAYELPAPAPTNARHIIRLPPQRLACHPHVVLGNGLDFTHVIPVHNFQLQADPSVELDSHQLTVEIHTRLGATWSRWLLGLAGREARWRFTTLGPSLAWLSVTEPTPFELVWAGRPLADGSCAMQTVFFLPSYSSIARALPVMIATTSNDKRVLEGVRFRQGFVASDAVFALYAQLIEGLPAWS